MIRPKLYFDIFYRDEHLKWNYTFSWMLEEEKLAFNKAIIENETVAILYKDGKLIIQGMPLIMANFLYLRIYLREYSI